MQELGRNADEIELTTGTPDMASATSSMADKGISRLVMPPPGTSADDIRRGLSSSLRQLFGTFGVCRSAKCRLATPTSILCGGHHQMA